MNANIFLGKDEELTRLLERSGRSEGDIASVKSMLFPGEPQALIDRLAEYREKARIDYVIGYFVDAASGPSLDRFAKQVMPALRSSIDS